MKRRQVAVCCVVIGFVLEGAAYGVTTVTPPVRSSEGDNLGCYVQNVGAEAVEVVSGINNGLGTIVDSQTLTVPAGQALQLARTSAAVFSAFCIFDFEGNPTEVRGFISLQDAGGSNTLIATIGTMVAIALGVLAGSVVSNRMERPVL